MDRVRSRKGFTLIELIVVVIVLGLLAAVYAALFATSNPETCHRDAETRAKVCSSTLLPQG